MRLIWGIDAIIAGAEYHFATEECLVDSVFYESGLSEDIELNRVMGITQFSVPIEITCGVNWAALAAANQHKVNGGKATIYLIVEENGTYTRIRWVDGVVLIRSIPVQYSSLAFTVEQSLAEPMIPFPGLTINGATFPITPSPSNMTGTGSGSSTFRRWLESFGAKYPIVFGYPGFNSYRVNRILPGETLNTRIDEATVAVVPTPPCQATWITTATADDINDVVSTDYEVPEYVVYLLGSSDYGDWGATQVLWEETSIHANVLTADGTITEVDVEQRNGSRVASIERATDNTGNQRFYFYEYLYGTAYSGAPIAYFGMNPLRGGGIKHKGELIRGASDIFDFLITKFTNYRFDAGRNSSFAHILNTYLFDGFINDDVQLFEWFLQNIEAHIPAKVVRGPGEDGGVYLCYMPLIASRTDAQMTITAGTNGVERMSDFYSLSVDKPCNEITVQWARNTAAGSYIEWVCITSEAGKKTATESLPGFQNESYFGDALCSVSQGEYGVLPLTVTLDSVWDANTAIQIAKDYVTKKAMGTSTMRYSLPVQNYTIEPGMVVLVNDEDLSFQNKLARVNDVTISTTKVIVDLQFIKTNDSYL